MPIRNIVKLGLVLALVFIVASLTIAQDEMTDEELAALIERLTTAIETADEGVETYMADYSVASQQVLNLQFGEQSFAQTSTNFLEATWAIILGDNPNGSGEVRTTIESNPGTGEISLIDIIAEVRYVDGVLYVNAAYADGETPPGTFELPVGWVVVEDVANFPEFSSLSLDVFLDAFDEESDSDLLATILTVLETALAVTTTQDEVEGVPVEIIEFVFDGEGFLAFMNTTLEDTPESLPLFEMMAASTAEGDTPMTITFVLDEEDTLLTLDVELNVAVEGGDASVLGEGVPPDSTIDLSLMSTNTQTRYNINAPIEPVEAPELGG